MRSWVGYEAHSQWGPPGWGGILSNQTLRETSEGMRAPFCPPLSSLVFSVIHCFDFSQLGAVRRAQVGKCSLHAPALSSSASADAQYCFLRKDFLKSLHKQKHQKQPYFFKAESQKTEEIEPQSNYSLICMLGSMCLFSRELVPRQGCLGEPQDWLATCP